MKVDILGSLMTVKVRRECAADACEAIRVESEFPPDGYKWIGANVHKRAKSGRAVNLAIYYEHIDRRVDPFDENEAWDFFNALAVAKEWSPPETNLLEPGDDRTSTRQGGGVSD